MISPKVKFIAKSLLIKTPIGTLGRWVKKKTGKREWYRNRNYWDSELAGPRASYLKSRGVDISNAVMRVLIEQSAPYAKAILDVGCASGELAKYVDMDVYTGIDISDYAIEEAKKTMPAWKRNVASEFRSIARICASMFLSRTRDMT